MLSKCILELVNTFLSILSKHLQQYCSYEIKKKHGKNGFRKCDSLFLIKKKCKNNFFNENEWLVFLQFVKKSTEK